MPPYIKAKITRQLLNFFGDNDRRIEHALEVLKHAEIISESRSGWDRETLIASALLHNAGIKPSEEKRGYNNGHTQEEYGPPEAEKLLRAIDFPPEKTRKVSEIIENHHSPSKYDYIELEILKEADRIVNKMETEARKKGKTSKGLFEPS